MMNIKGTHGLAVLSLVVLLMAEVHETAPPPPANCNPTELLPCMPAIVSGQNPSPSCCSTLKEQEPCFCQYLSKPAYKPYIDSPNTRKVASYCNVTIPTNC